MKTMNSRRPRLEDVIVYTTISDLDDVYGVERMSLHPVDSRPVGEGPMFPFRVVWRWVAEQPVRRWMVSCRGNDCVGDRDITVDVDEDPTHAALAWLLEGETE